MYRNILKYLYEKYSVSDIFENDYEYLSESVNEINELWNINFNNIEKVNLIILSEAPMWGDDRKYFYNPDTNHSQFFYKSDLEYVTNQNIKNKQEMISELNKTGTVILDFSPFPFNPSKTKLSYKCDTEGYSKKIKKIDYQDILNNTFSKHLKPRLELIEQKTDDLKSIRICYRYGRVKKNLHKILKELFLKEGYVTIKNANSISMNGGGIDKENLKNEIKQHTVNN
ncbi:MAG: hypothetical protein EOM83_14210 [Clostridia bacterium]|nr:hypothetical protein [Clostridia bacterium]